MPNRPSAPCSQPGCNKLTDRGRCDEHRSEARATTDRTRETAARRGYGRKWRAYREGWLRSHPLCGDRKTGSSAEHSQCVRDGLATQGTDVDHIVPHGGDQALFWNPGNHQTLCGTCHDVKTATHDGGFGRPKRGGAGQIFGRRAP